MEKADHIVKFVILGDLAVGKTTFAKRICDPSFNPNSSCLPTCCAEFQQIRLDIPDGSTADVQLWDLEGKCEKTATTNMCMRGAHGVILMYDITQPDSFLSLSRWMQLVNHYTDEKFLGPKFMLAIVANKTDVFDFLKNKHVQVEDGCAVCDKYELPYVSLSASTSSLEQLTAHLLGWTVQAVEHSIAESETRKSREGAAVPLDGRSLLDESFTALDTDSTGCFFSCLKRYVDWQLANDSDEHGCFG